VVEVNFMGLDRENWEKEWAGFEPKQPRSGRWGCWLGAALILIVMLALCGIAGYLAWQQFGLSIGPGLILAPPTAIANNQDTGGPDAAQPTPAESPSMAATVTLPAPPDNGTVEARQMVVTPAIDGNLEEWRDLPTFSSDKLVYSVPEWDGTDDVQAVWRLGWDNDNLLVAVEVEDNLHVQTQRGNQIFKGDSVSLQLDSDLTGDYGPGLSNDDYQINLSPGDFAGIPPSAFRFQGGRDAPGHGIIVAAEQTERGYLLEAAIPWQDMGLAPSPGLEIGLALNVNDNDTPGTDVQEVMKSHMAARAFRDPTSWGRLILR
jgi:hypothetical protein